MVKLCFNSVKFLQITFHTKSHLIFYHKSDIGVLEVQVYVVTYTHTQYYNAFFISSPIPLDSKFL